jgi:hypothetical protein
MENREGLPGFALWYRLTKVGDNFRSQIQSVEKLLNFDREVLDIAIERVHELRDRLKAKGKFADIQLHAERTAKLLANIRQNDSLRNRYEIIANQALVLLVSYFSSSVHALFTEGVREALLRDMDSSLLRENLRISFRELRDANFDLRERAADLLVQSKDISFQDMQSIVRAFQDYVGISMEKTDEVNDLILALSGRHAIVHKGGIADTRFIRQIADATPRKIKPDVALNHTIQFSDTEVLEIARSMLAYIEIIAAKIMARFDVDKSLRKILLGFREKSSPN